MTILTLRDLGLVGSGVLWTPAQISTAQWLDAADASTVTIVSGAVSQWNDKSGNARHVSQETANARPTYPSNILSAKSVVRFDGIDDFLQTAIALFTTASFGFYCVVRNRSTSAQYAFAGQYVVFNPGRTLLYQNGADSRLAALFTGSNGIELNGTADTLFHLFGHEINGTNGALYYEAVLAGTVTSLSNQIANTTWKIGRPGDSGATAFPAQLDAAEMIALSIPATADTRQRIEGYLAHKWGLTANLPAAHPYKYAPPYA